MRPRSCPICHSIRIVLVIGSDPRAFCVMCGARWREIEGQTAGPLDFSLVQHPAVASDENSRPEVPA